LAAISIAPAKLNTVMAAGVRARTELSEPVTSVSAAALDEFV
jgi:hypothetical protein